MEASQAEQKVNLSRYLNILGTLGNTAPFIGLLGTVLGIIKAFKDLAGSAGAGPEVVMVGIAEALIATAAGLGVAIPAVIIFNYFTDRVKNICVEMDTVSKKVLVILANYGEGAHARRK
jgi:biopolymer transport protein ExbB